MKTKKLALNRETLRALQDTDLRLIIGGWEQQPIGPPDVVVAGPAVQLTIPGLCIPCGSSITDGGGYLQPLPPNG